MNYASQVLCSTLKKRGEGERDDGKGHTARICQQGPAGEEEERGDKVSLSHHPSSTLSHVKRYKQRWEGGRRGLSPLLLDAAIRDMAWHSMM